MRSIIGTLGLCLYASLATAQVTNLANSFYARKGLEKMPRLNWKKMPLVNVLDCGADNTGKKLVGPAFKKAVGKLKAKGGGVVYIPAGKYRFKNPISDHKKFDDRYSWLIEGLKNIHFVGAGPEKTIIITEYDGVKYPGDPAPYLWMVRDSENISFRDLSFSIFPFFGMRSPRMAEGVFSLAFANNKGVQVINVTCDQGRIPICFWHANTNAWVVDCDVRNTGADAIKFDSSCDTVAAYNYVEWSNDDSFSGLEMKAGPAVNNSFLYNTIVYDRGWGRGIAISGKGHKVIGNWIESQCSASVLLHDLRKNKKTGYGCTDFTIADNTLIRSDLQGIAENNLKGSRRYGAVSCLAAVNDVKISNNKIFGSGTNGIAFFKKPKADDVIFAGNRIEGCLEYGLYFSIKNGGSMKNCKLADNTIAGNLAGSIFMRGNITNTLFQNNAVDKTVSIQDSPKLLPMAKKVPVSKAVPEYIDIYKTARTAKPPVSQKVPVIKSIGPVIDIRTFGAAGDGKTSDTTAFMKAIAALPDDGGILKIPAGKYLLKPLSGQDSLPFTCIRHTVLIKDKKNITISVEGAKSVLMFPSLNHEGLRLVGLENVVVRNLTLQATGKSYHRKNRSPLDIVASKNVILDKVTSLDAVGYGLRFDASTSVLLKNCTVKNANQIGINLFGCRQVTVKDCEVFNTRDHGINISSIGGIARMPMFIDIADCKITGTREGIGISLNSGTEIKVRNCKITDTYHSGIAAYYVNPIFPLEKIFISGNTLTNCDFGEYAIMRGAISGLNIPARKRRSTGRFLPVIIGNTIDTTPANGIWLYNCDVGDSAIVKNNIFKNIKLEKIVIKEAPPKKKKKK